MDPFTAGASLFGTAASLGAGLFGSHNNSNQNFSWYQQAQGMLDMQANQIREKQMNLDAQRRKRDIIRQAQVATATAENTAANSGALNSSGIEGARASISGQAGVNILGIEQNRELGARMFAVERERARMGMLAGFQKSSQKANFWDKLGGVGSAATGQNIEAAGKIGQWGWGKFNQPSQDSQVMGELLWS